MEEKVNRPVKLKKDNVEGTSAGGSKRKQPKPVEDAESAAEDGAIKPKNKRKSGGLKEEQTRADIGGKELNEQETKTKRRKDGKEEIGNAEKEERRKRKGTEEVEDTPMKKKQFKRDAEDTAANMAQPLIKEEEFVSEKEAMSKKTDDEFSLYDEPAGPDQKYVGSNPKQDYRPPTLTGLTELPVKDFFLILLLWVPRYFVPWISAWHEFNVFILAHPDHLESRKEDLNRVDLIVFGVACVLSILVSIVADMVSLRYYIYLLLLLLYTLCPIAGGYVDVVLRSRMLDKNLYNHWFSAIMLMRAAMAIPLVFFPVQFTCIFTEKDNMSRQAHYNWVAFFAFFEFVNAYVAFWTIPAKCPTGQWTQIGVWILILTLLYLLVVVTLTFSLIVASLRYTLMTCLKFCGLPDSYFSEEYNKNLIKDRIPKDLRLRKLQWFGLLLIPLVFSSFVFATLERFVPDEDWDKHYVLSATSMFYLGRMLGVGLMVGTLFWIRHGLNRILKIPIFRGDVLVFGLPHVLNILALLVLVGRYATLSSLNPGDVTIGPIPDDTKDVVLFFNLMYRNKTVCVSSESIRPVKVRAYRHAARELYGLPEKRLNFTFTPEPSVKPVVATSVQLNELNCKTRNNFIIYTINMFGYLNENDAEYKEKMNKPRVVRHYNFYQESCSSKWTFHKPSSRVPRVMLINNFVTNTESYTRSYRARKGNPPRNRIDGMHVANMRQSSTIIFWEPPSPGKWYIWGLWEGWSGNKPMSQPVEVDLESNTLYVVTFYLTAAVKPSDVRYREQLWVKARSTVIGQLAGEDSRHFPAKKELQRDWAIQFGMTLAGMSAGGIFVGIVYLFWMDPPFPGWQTTALAVFWVLMMGAAESPKVKLVDVGLRVSSVLLVLQILLVCLHVFASMNLYTPPLNFRKRPD